MPTGTSVPVTQDWGTVNVGRGGGTSKPKTARGIDIAKATGLIATEKRYGAGGNASAHSAGIMSAKKVRMQIFSVLCCLIDLCGFRCRCLH
jgi:hypothetical protein